MKKSRILLSALMILGVGYIVPQFNEAKANMMALKDYEDIYRECCISGGWDSCGSYSTDCD